MSQQSTITQNDAVSTVVSTYSLIPYAIIADELSGSAKNDFFNELGDIVKYYETYSLGHEFHAEGDNGDYIPSDIRFKKAKSLIDKEARFLFSKTPDFHVNPNDVNNANDNTIMNDFLQKVLTKTGFDLKLLKSAKDCFIGKRIACMLNFNDNTGISATFLNSIEFMYDTDNTGALSMIVAFYKTHDATDKSQQRIMKKKYYMDNGYCYVTEKLFDGLGNVIENYPILQDVKTLFTFIPAAVILNDGLTNDGKGESEIAVEQDYETGYSKLANGDIDAERKSMNPVRYAIDATPESTTGLSSAAGAFWDIQSKEDGQDAKVAAVGVIECNMGYSDALKTTLDRIENAMYSQLDVPNINSEQLQGVITSGKTLKALYWGLSVRCDEKMLSWRPALEYIATAIIEGGKLYPKAAAFYTSSPIPNIEYEVCVENNYPLPEDEEEEKTMDLSEVAAMTMSRTSYMKKWRKLTDDEAKAEFLQIMWEQQAINEGAMPDTSGSATGLDTQPPQGTSTNTEQALEQPAVDDTTQQ